MATFSTQTTADINSDWLFPGLNGAVGVVEQTLTNFSVEYLNGPAKGHVVTFVSTGGNFQYGADNLPASGMFDTIELWTDGLIPIKLATWAGLVPAPLTEFKSETLASVLLAGDDILLGMGGNDVLNGHGGHDQHGGSAGNDVFVFHPDTVTGPGAQTGHANGSAGFDTIKALGSVDIFLNFLSEIDALTFASNANSDVTFTGVQLSPNVSSNFRITGDSYANTVEFEAQSGYKLNANLSNFSFSNWGKADKVKVSGGSLEDTLIGSKVADIINGGAGDDMLRGGVGRDILTGGADSDLFDFNSIKDSVKGSARDVITDFKRGQDHIDLKGIDAKAGISGNQNFKWIGKSDFHDKKGELRYEDKGSKVIVQGDVNGDGKTDFEILVKVGALGSGDFLL